MLRCKSRTGRGKERSKGSLRRRPSYRGKGKRPNWRPPAIYRLEARSTLEEEEQDAKMRRKTSRRLLKKIEQCGVEAVLADLQDMLSVLLLFTDDPAYIAVRCAAEEEKRCKQLASKKHTRDTIEMRPVHVAIGKGATQVYWREVKRKKDCDDGEWG